MSSPFPMGDIGPCQAYFDGVDLGPFESISLNVTDDVADVMTAQNGSQRVDGVFTGRSFEVQFNGTRSSLTQLQKLIVGSTKTGDELMISNPVGETLRDNAGKLVLKRLVGSTVSTDPTEWITCFVACPRVNFEIPFDATTQRTFASVFLCLPVEGEIPSGETYEAGDVAAVGYGETS